MPTLNYQSPNPPDRDPRRFQRRKLKEYAIALAFVAVFYAILMAAFYLSQLKHPISRPAVPSSR